MKNIIKKIFTYDLEIFFMKNITGVSFFLIGLVLLIDILPYFINQFYGIKFNLISTTFTISTIGAILAFWYGYKKYARDKDIEMLGRFQIGELLIENMNEIDIEELKNKFEVVSIFRKQGYINDVIWEVINKNNDEVIYKFLYKNLYDKTGKECIIATNKLLKLSGFRLFEYLKVRIRKISQDMDTSLSKGEYKKENIEKIIQFRINIGNLLNNINQL